MRRRRVILSILTVLLLSIPFTLWALETWQFQRLATGGFGDSANSYTWGLSEFRGNIYASTVRHHLWSIAQGMEGLLPIDLSLGSIVPGPSNPMWGDPEYADAMRGEIWRFKYGSWKRVYRSETYELTDPIPLPPEYGGGAIPAGIYPRAYGYRTLGTFKGKIYALGVGTWMPPMPFSSIVRSRTGNFGSWYDVTGALANTTNVRGFVEWRDKVFVSASVPGGILGLAGGSVVFGSEDGQTWIPMSEIGFGNPDNVEIYYLAVFDDHLYASTVNYVTGFEVWKTDGTMADGKFVWTPVIREGFGDTWNQYGMTMQPFGDYMYVGSAVGIGLVLKDGQLAGTRAIDIIRVDKDDNAQLVVGAYIPKDPPAGWPTFRVPLSFMPAGFGNPFNVYTWHMTVYQNYLVLGTLDLSGTILRVLSELILSDPQAAMQMIQAMGASSLSFAPELLEVVNNLNLENAEQLAGASVLVEYIINKYGGADLWRTQDGIHWEPVTLNGFDNPLNYGIRRTVTVPSKYQSGIDRLYIGTANPFTGMPGGGCEVLVATPNMYEGETQTEAETETETETENDEPVHRGRWIRR